MRYFLLMIMLGSFGCEVNNVTVTDRDGDEELFSTQVQPILQADCGFLGCHGREGMPLTLYSVHYLRLRDPDGLIDDTRPPLDEENLSTAEISHNRRSLAARIGPDDPKGDRERFLRRLVSLDQGGTPHAGVVVFETTTDPQLETLREFLETVGPR